MAGDRGSRSFGITTRLIRVRKNLWVALTICAAVLVVGWGAARLARWRIDRAENRRVEVVWGEIEARSPVKTPPVLVMGGSVADREFELVMRGFTNYCLKETWGRDRGGRATFRSLNIKRLLQASLNRIAPSQRSGTAAIMPAITPRLYRKPYAQLKSPHNCLGKKHERRRPIKAEP